MEANITFRIANIHDIPGILSLIEENYNNGRLMRVPDKKLKRNIDNIAIAEINHKIVGCCSLIKHANKYYELGTLSVKHEARGKNIGILLMTKLLEKVESDDFVFAATQIPEYAGRIGFIKTDGNGIPLIVWIHKINTLFHQRFKDIFKIMTNKYV